MMMSSWSGAHHVGALGLEDADDFEVDVLQADFLADGRFVRRKASRTMVWPITQTLLQLRTSRSVKASPSAISRPIAHFQERRGGAAHGLLGAQLRLP